MFSLLRTKYSPPSLEEIRACILNFLDKKHPRQGERLLSQTHLLDEWGLDSMDLVELIVHLEKSYGIDFLGNEDIPTLNDVAALAAFTQRSLEKTRE